MKSESWAYITVLVHKYKEICVRPVWMNILTLVLSQQQCVPAIHTHTQITSVVPKINRCILSLKSNLL
jgi:hypothetical protein